MLACFGLAGNRPYPATQRDAAPRCLPSVERDVPRTQNGLDALGKASFGARIVRPILGFAATAQPRLNLLRIEEDLSGAHLRLARVFIECKPYDQVIERFDKPGTLFYVDAPYWDCEKDYGEGLFSREDFGRLAGLLGAVKGKFILSLNDTPWVRETFADFRIEGIKTRYSVAATKKAEAAEVLITNFR